METQLVYLHIEKTAGSSMRDLLFANYGSDDVFWYLVDSKSPTFKQEELAGQRVIGGHRDKLFYTPLRKSKLYLSVVREPVSRVISLFNYHGRINPAKEVWHKRGLDPMCLDTTLAKCPEFINEITNRQCQIISGHRSAEKTLEAIEKEHYIIGTMDHLPSFVAHVSSMLDWSINNIKKANPGGSSHTDSIAVSENTLNIIRSLNKEDQKLYDHVNSRILIDSSNDSIRSVFSLELSAGNTRPNAEFSKVDISDISCYTTKSKADSSSLELSISTINDSQHTLPKSGSGTIWFGIKEGHKELRQNLNNNTPPETSIDQIITLPKPDYSCNIHISLIKKNEYWFSTVNPKHAAEYDFKINN